MIEQKLQELERQIQEYRQELRDHRHNGLGTLRLNLTDVDGLIKTVSTAPTHTPKNQQEQVILYTSGATYRIYFYDNSNGAWRYVALT